MLAPRISGAFAVIAFALGCFAAPAAAQILSVPSVTYPTVQSAVDAAMPGDTIQIATGTFLAAGGGPGVVNVIGKSDLIIEGAGTTATIIDAQMSFTGGVFIQNSSNITVRDLTVRNMNRHGVIGFNSTDMTITDVRAQGLGATVASANGVVYGFGILNVPNSVIDNVTAEDCSGGGFQFTGGSTNCTLSNFTIVDCAGVQGFAAVSFDTIGGIDVVGGNIGVDISGSNTIIGCPAGFLFLDSPAGTIDASLTGTTSVFGVISEVSILGAGVINGLNDFLTGLGIQFSISDGVLGTAYFSSLANAQIGVALAPNPEDLILTELGTSTIFVTPGMSIQTAVDAAGANGTVCVLPGTYTTTSGNGVVSITQDGLTLKGTDRDTVILDSQSNRNYVIRIDDAVGVTISDLTVTGANFEHLTAVNSNDTTVDNIRIAGAGNTVQGVSGRIHGIVLNTNSTGAVLEDIIAENLSGAGIQLSPGAVAIVRDCQLLDTAGNIGFAAITVFVSGGQDVPDGPSTLNLEGTNVISNTALGGNGILLADTPGFVLNINLDDMAAVNFTNVALPLSRFGAGCIPLIDDTAVAMGLPWRVTGGEPLIPQGAAYFPDMLTAQGAAALAPSPMDAVVEEVFAQPFPGSGEDFQMLTFVNGMGTGSEPMKSVVTDTDLLTIEMSTPCGTFINSIPILAVEFWSGISPPSNAFFPFAHLSVSQAVVIFDGSQPGPFGPTFLTATPIALNFIPPSTLTGLVGRVQAFVSTPTAANGIFGGSNAHEITFN